MKKVHCRKPYQQLTSHQTSATSCTTHGTPFATITYALVFCFLITNVKMRHFQEHLALVLSATGLETMRNVNSSQSVAHESPLQQLTLWQVEKLLW